MPKPDQVKKGRRNAQKVLQDDNFEEALLELDKEGDEFEKAKKNPKQWLKDQGVNLPGNPTVKIEDGSIRIGLCWGDLCLWIEW